MEKRKQKLKYYPSQAAFVVGEEVVTGYPSGCPRNILFASYGIRTESIPEVYQTVGAMNELRHQADLLADSSIVEAEAEVPVRGPIYGSDTVEYSGRIDFWVTHEDGTEVPHECKATVSRAGFQSMKRNAAPKVNHLAQLVSYMLQTETQDAQLVYGYYQYPWSIDHDAPNLECTDSVTFDVRIEDSGTITVGGKPTIYTAQDQLKHMQLAVKTLTENKLTNRPASENAWSNPCNLCPFSNTCDKVDAGLTDLEEILMSAEEDITKVEEREPKIFRPKRRPKK